MSSSSSYTPPPSYYFAQQMNIMVMIMGAGMALFSGMLLWGQHQESENKLARLSGDLTQRSVAVFNATNKNPALKDSWPAQVEAISNRLVRHDAALLGVSPYDGDLLATSANDDNIVILPATGNEAGQMVVQENNAHLWGSSGCIFVDPAQTAGQNEKVVNGLLRGMAAQVWNGQGKLGFFAVNKTGHGAPPHIDANTPQPACPAP